MMPITAPDQNKDKPATVNATNRTPNLKFWVPAFYDEDPELWFWQLESTFIDLLTKKDPYTAIKNLVVKETDMSDYQRFEKLHALPALGDQRPFNLLASICNLQPEGECKCYCSRYKFLSQMPPITRAQLVSRRTSPSTTWLPWRMPSCCPRQPSTT